jgi:hypothetical protein
MRTIFEQGVRSPALFRLCESLDAFHDNEAAFQEYLDDQEAQTSAEAFDLRVRSTLRVYPKVWSYLQKEN